MARTTPARLDALERKNSDHDRFGHYGADGMRLVRLAIPDDDGNLPPNTRPMTEADVAWLRTRGERVIMIPDRDDRYEVQLDD